MTDEKQTSQDEQNKALFIQLVVMLATSAMQQLGKLTNPATGKTEIHLDAAEASIDFIDMLRVKTKGNLDPQEERVVADSLHSLRMNYWETRQQLGSSAPNPEADQPAAPAASGEPAPADKKPEESKEPRFQKKYG